MLELYNVLVVRNLVQGCVACIHICSVPAAIATIVMVSASTVVVPMVVVPTVPHTGDHPEQLSHVPQQELVVLILLLIDLYDLMIMGRN